jgi:hypothetical protein
VVEHSIGNGEVDSSILSGSTIISNTENARFARDGAEAGRTGMTGILSGDSRLESMGGVAVMKAGGI